MKHPTQVYHIKRYDFNNNYNILEKFLSNLNKIGDQKNKWRNNQVDMKHENSSYLERFIGKDSNANEHDTILKKLGLSYLPKISHNPAYIRNMMEEDIVEDLGPINIFQDIYPKEPRFKNLVPDKQKFLLDSDTRGHKSKIFQPNQTFEKNSMLSRLCKNKSGKNMSLKNTFQSFYNDSAKNRQSMSD